MLTSAIKFLIFWLWYISSTQSNYINYWCWQCGMQNTVGSQTLREE